MTAAAWLSRRRDSFGASEAAMVLVLAGRASIDRLPPWQQERIRPMVKQYSATPRLLLEKAGIVRPLRAGPAAAIGIERERELLAAWSMELATGDIAIPEETVLDVETVRHASSVPREWYPLRSRRGRISVTPDAWVRDHFDTLYDVELKTTTSDAAVCRWVWQCQVQAQGMATGSGGAFVVCGNRWARAERDDGPIGRAFIAPDEALRTQIADASDEMWERVEELRNRYGGQA